MNFKEEMFGRIDRVEEILKEYLPEEKGFQKEVMSAMEYSVMAGGKRVRPLLMEAVYRLFGGKGREIQPFMAAMEMIHTYSLVHDDLPAMDNDEYRRGRKTTHIVYGHAMGILAGDALLNYAYETALKAFDFPNTDTKTIARALQVLAKKAGIYGMVGGQVVDVAMSGKPLDRERLDFIYRLKTGALMEAAMMIGAILAGADTEQVKQIEQAAADIGLAFQIQDDILDVTSTTEILGKPVFSDEKNNKTTYVTFEGLEEAQRQVAELSNGAISVIMEIPGEKEFLCALIKNLIHREK